MDIKQHSTVYTCIRSSLVFILSSRKCTLPCLQKHDLSLWSFAQPFHWLLNFIRIFKLIYIIAEGFAMFGWDGFVCVLVRTNTLPSRRGLFVKTCSQPMIDIVSCFIIVITVSEWNSDCNSIPLSEVWYGVSQLRSQSVHCGGAEQHFLPNIDGRFWN